MALHIPLAAENRLSRRSYRPAPAAGPPCRGGACLAGIMTLLLATFSGASEPVDIGDISAAGGDGWVTFGGDYTNGRFADHAQINRENVARLAPAWIYHSGQRGPFQAQPLVADDVMYVTLPGNDVVALNAADGTELWRYTHRYRRERTRGGPSNRGAALGHGKVFEATNDGRLLALDQRTGRVVWDVVIARPLPSDLADLPPEAEARARENIDGLPAKMPPLVYRGMVIVGVTAAGYGMYYDLVDDMLAGAAPDLDRFVGMRGYIAAYAADTGRELWRWHTTRAGWEGGFAAATPTGEALPRDLDAERAALPAHRQRWRAGGSSTWSTPALDPALGLLYLGTGNASPNDVSLARPGDNLHANSLVALDVKTGEMRWHYQQVPHDLWGYDVASPALLFDARVGAATVPAVGVAGKTGWFYAHDRNSGRLLYRSPALVPQFNMFARPTAEGVVAAPGSFGGVSWSPGSMDPRTGLAYFGAVHMPTRYQQHEVSTAAGEINVITTEIAESAPRWGTLSAVDTGNAGRLRWQVRTEQPLVGGVLATAGDLVFAGHGDGSFVAYDAASGRRLWAHQVGAGVNAPPVAYRVDGRQFVAVAAGGSKYFGFPAGDILIAFALPAESRR